MADAARRAGRPPESVRLICVTKSATLAQLHEAIAAGVTECGESRVQEARPKIAAAGRAVRWHLIGPLQRNKARAALELFEMLHAVEDVALPLALARHAVALGRTVPVLIEVNTSGEAAKHGVAPADTEPLLAAIRPLEGLAVRGLMTMAPAVPRPELARPSFRALRELAGGLGLPELSMGMSQDFEVAIEEGATMVRIGGAIFGAREA